MIRLTIILVLFTTQSWGQSTLDYEIYSKVIDDYVDQWDTDRDSITQVIVIKKFKTKDNYAFDYVQSIYDDNIEMVRVITRYDEDLISLIRGKEIKEILTSLAFDFEESPRIEKRQLKLKTPAITISSSKYKSFFKKLFKYKIDKGWKRFYKKYPSTLGVFELSKVEYSGNYACMYFGHHGNGLSGTGDIVILEKKSGKWEIIRHINLWMS